MTTTKASSVVHHGSISGAEREQLGCGADLEALPRAFGAPPVRGVLRRRPEDFIVAEQLPFCPSGAGEHLYLLIRKTGQNTQWVARRLAAQLGLRGRAIGFAGLKDRHAVTTQWFSVHLPGQPNPAPELLAIDGVEIVEAIRHTAKLRTGALRGNRFRLVIRDLVGDLDALTERLDALRSRPVPNYFGAQRFGRGGANLDLLSTGRSPGRDARSFGLSALRSALFNLWLARRIEAGTWDTRLTGEILYRPDEGRFLHESKLEAGDTGRPTGLLWGVGDNQASGPALAAEQDFFAPFSGARDMLAAFDARMMRRPLAIDVAEVDFVLDGDTLELGFMLARGQFATTVIRELGEFFDSA